METFQPKSILCPIDFSEPATSALSYGKHLAVCFGARLTVLYADPFSPPPYFTSGQVEDLAHILTEGRWTHDYPITYEEATHLGLHVTKGIPAQLYQLMSLYPQPVRHQPSVEYLPIPRFKGPAPKP